MTSSSGLYGEAKVPAVKLAEPTSASGQDVNSTNSTSLYGGASTPIPDSSGNLIVRGDLVVLSGNILTTASTGNIFPENATTVNIATAGTTVNIGAGSGTTTINNNLQVNGTFITPSAEFGNITIAVDDAQTISTTSGDLVLDADTGVVTVRADHLATTATAFNLLNTPTTVTAFADATALQFGAATGITYIRNEVHVGEDLQVNGNHIKSGAGTTAITLSNDDVTIADDLTINGNNLNLAQATTIGYSENNSRANRPTVRSTTGNSSGFRVEAPNALTGSNANLTVFNTNDINNGQFISVQAIGSASAPFNIRTGTYSGGVLSSSNDVLSFVDGTTTYATINPAGPTNGLDLTTKTYVDSIIPDVPTYDTNVVSVTGGVELDLRELNPPSIMIVGSTKFLGGTNITISETAPNEITIDGTDLNTTYTVDASTTTGGANFNLTGSDASVDTIKFANGSNVTVTATDANTITIAATDTNTTYNIDATSTTGGANLNLNGSDATVDPVAFLGSGATTVTRTDANTITVSSTDTNTTYTYAASATTGGANLTLTGSDASTNTVKVSSGTGITVADVSGTEISITNSGVTALAAGTGIGVSASTGSVTVSNTGVTSAVAGTGIGVSAATGAVTFSNTGVTSLAAGTYLSVNASTGAVTVSTNATSANTASTLVARDASGNFSAGTITANFTDGDRVLGSLTASTNTSYVFGAPVLNTITNNNGLDAASSFQNGNTLGNGAQGQFTHYFGDTFAGPNTSAVFSLRTANGNSVTGSTLPFSGLTSVAPSAVTAVNTIGGLNFNGYATTGFSDYVGSQNQGGGFNAVHALQAQAYPLETFADGTLTISGATITAVSRVNVAQTVTSVSGTRGQLTIPSTLAGVGTAVVVTGTLTGTATGISAGTYYIVANNGGASNSTEITLSATVGGAPITTTAGTVTGLTFTRQLITVTYSAQSYIPFGANAKVAISGFTNVTSGTFMVVGTSTTTSVTIGATSSGAPALSGSQSVSCPTVTAGGTGFRVRGFPAATPLNSGNRVEFINTSAASTTIRSNTVNLNTGAYGNTGVGITGDKIVYNRVYGQWQWDATVTPALANTAYVFPIQGASGTIDLANIATVASTSRIIPGAAGIYKLQFSVQIANADNGAEHTAFVWWRKNGTDIPSSMGRVTVPKAGATIAGWDNMISSANTTDYWELAYAVDTTQLTFPYYAATAFGPATACLFITLIPVGA